MLEFKKIEIKDIETIKTYISLTGKFSCENNFVNLLVWQCAFNKIGRGERRNLSVTFR